VGVSPGAVWDSSGDRKLVRDEEWVDDGLCDNGSLLR
jgi:hypothetical protein